MKYKFLFITLLLGLARHGTTQIEVMYFDEVARIKKGTTYITFNDTNTQIAKQYMDIYRKYWTCSKIQFINDSDIDKHIAPESSFFTMSYLDLTNNATIYRSPTGGASFMPTPGQLNRVEHHAVRGVYMFMSLWTYDEYYFTRKNKKPPTAKDEVRIARVELFPDYKTLITPDNIHLYDYDWGGHIRNWGPGMLKNYLQCLMTYFNGNNQDKIFEKEEIVNKDELAHLQTQTLYIPDYTLIYYNAGNGDESEQNDPKELFANYAYPYKVIPTKDLNDKILAGGEPFYYLVYVKDCACKLITIINSQTGNIVYSDYIKYSYNLNSSNLKDIYKTIRSCK
jgi:hypothetical protein